MQALSETGLLEVYFRLISASKRFCHLATLPWHPATAHFDYAGALIIVVFHHFVQKFFQVRCAIVDRLFSKRFDKISCEIVFVLSLENDK